MSKQITDEFIQEAFLEHGELTEDKICSIVESLGFNKGTDIKTPMEIFGFKKFLTLMDIIKSGKTSEEVKVLFIKTGSITRENTFTVLNHCRHIVEEAEIQDIMGKREVESYSFNGFLNIMTCVHMREVFKKFDKDGSGFITLHELGNFLEENKGKYVTFHEVTQKMKKADINNDGKISYQEFLIMMVNGESDYKDNIREAFKAFDVNGDGFITRDELKEVLANAGGSFSDDEIDGIVKGYDQDGDDRINMDEFIATIDWSN